MDDVCRRSTRKRHPTIKAAAAIKVEPVDIKVEGIKVEQMEIVFPNASKHRAHETESEFSYESDHSSVPPEEKYKVKRNRRTKKESDDILQHKLEDVIKRNDEIRQKITAASIGLNEFKRAMLQVVTTSQQGSLPPWPGQQKATF